MLHVINTLDVFNMINILNIINMLHMLHLTNAIGLMNILNLINACMLHPSNAINIAFPYRCHRHSSALTLEASSDAA